MALRARDGAAVACPVCVYNRLRGEQGGALLFAAFQHRDEAHALLARCLPPAAARRDSRQDSAGRATS